MASTRQNLPTMHNLESRDGGQAQVLRLGTIAEQNFNI